MHYERLVCSMVEKESSLRRKKEYFSSAYKISKQEDIDLLYTRWADSYDDELKKMKYQSPIRCASALAKFVPLDIPVLDFGCGTGLSGEALKEVGFQNIFGAEINNKMRKIAEQKSIYKEFFYTDKTNPFPLAVDFYGICAVGVISSGAGPPSLLRKSLNCLKQGGFLCFSFNEQTLSVPAYTNALKEVKETGAYREVFSERGEHLPAKGLSSTVYVFQKLME